MNVKYDYERIVQGILDIGEAMLQSGAERRTFVCRTVCTVFAEVMDL